MFYGEYQHSIDRKGRLILPAKIRDAAKTHFIDKFMVTRGLDTCLFMFAEEEWRLWENKFKASPFTMQESRAFNRIFFSGACDLVPDKQGRILLPQYLKDHANIKKDVVIVGVSNRIEIWAEDKWKEFFGSSQTSFEQIAEKMGNG